MAVNWQKEPPVVGIGEAKVIAADDMTADTRRGGDVRTLLSPKTADTKTGFMGVATLAPGDSISEHWHPFSEEFIYCVRGTLTADLDDEPRQVQAGEGLYIPFMMRHRLRNEGDEEAFIVFHLGQLAPRADLGHVDTE
ncbi:MAG: putative monooxygenase [Solirubrobacteraceae bacterium]|nr:putative monooxygenase [Solirubrobacteraceae bacterium]